MSTSAAINDPSRPSPLTELPSILWQSINRFVVSREVVLHCARVSRSWRATAAQPFSTKVLPADDDHSAFLASRPGHIWPWKYNPFTPNVHTINLRLEQICASPMVHQVRVWPNIPLKEDGIDITRLAQLKYIHTLVSAQTTRDHGLTRNDIWCVCDFRRADMRRTLSICFVSICPPSRVYRVYSASFDCHHSLFLIFTL
jgi:hypothetical protein